MPGDFVSIFTSGSFLGAPLAEADLVQHVVGNYYSAQFGSTANNALTLNSEYAFPFIVPAAHTYDRIVCEVSGGAQASAVIRLGIRYDAGGVPGAVILDAGTVDCSTTGSKSITISQFLPRGVVWLTGACQGATCTAQSIAGLNPRTGAAGGGQGLNTNTNGISVVQTGVSGALPSTFTISSIGLGIRIALRA